MALSFSFCHIYRLLCRCVNVGRMLLDGTHVGTIDGFIISYKIYLHSRFDGVDDAVLNSRPIWQELRSGGSCYFALL